MLHLGVIFRNLIPYGTLRRSAGSSGIGRNKGSLMLGRCYNAIDLGGDIIRQSYLNGGTRIDAEICGALLRIERGRMYLTSKNGDRIEIGYGCALASLANGDFDTAADGLSLSRCELVGDRTVRMMAGSAKGAEVVVVHDAEDYAINRKLEIGTAALEVGNDALCFVEAVGT